MERLQKELPAWLAPLTFYRKNLASGHTFSCDTTCTGVLLLCSVVKEVHPGRLKSAIVVIRCLEVLVPEATKKVVADSLNDVSPYFWLHFVHHFEA